MQCPKCGYELEPFDKTCPRCARLGTRAIPARPAPARPRFDPLGLVYEITSSLGWPLFTLLLLVIAYNGMLLGAAFVNALSVQLSTPSQETVHTAGAAMLLRCVFPALRFTGGIYLMRAERWGMYLFTFCTFWPMLTSVFVRHWSYFSFSLFEVILGTLVCFLVVIKWHEFEA